MHIPSILYLNIILKHFSDSLHIYTFGDTADILCPSLLLKDSTVYAFGPNLV